MASKRRVENLSRPGYFMNLAAAQTAVDNCSAEWVEPGVSIRALTPAEAMAARKQQEQGRGWVELPDCRFDPPASGIELTMRGWALVKEANEILTRRTAPAPFLKFERPQTARPTPDRACLVA